VLLGGYFTAVNGATRRAVARVHGDQTTPELLLFYTQILNGACLTCTKTVTNKTYFLEYKNSLNASAWNPAQAVSGDGTVKLLTDPDVIHTQRFYRLRAQ